MTPNGQQAQEQVDINRVLAIYRGKLAQAHDDMVILEARILTRDEEIAELRRQLEKG